MWFAIVCEDIPGSLEKRLLARPEHVARLRALQDEGRLMLAGPFPAVAADDPGDAGYAGSLIVAEFASLEEAESWASADPYRKAGVYATITVRPFRKVFPQ